ncbi:MAG: hypothetical protein OIF54_09790, partial [Cohaesibacter sp.]|nr:hypothetical protein [Cohaesibacter sp.]
RSCSILSSRYGWLMNLLICPYRWLSVTAALWWFTLLLEAILLVALFWSRRYALKDISVAPSCLMAQ